MIVLQNVKFSHLVGVLAMWPRWVLPICDKPSMCWFLRAVVEGALFSVNAVSASGSGCLQLLAHLVGP